VKRLGPIILILLLLVSTTGISVQLRYCSGELMSVSVNSMEYRTAKSRNLPPCCTGDSCPMGHSKHFHLQVSDSYSMGQTVQALSPLTGADWFHGGLPVTFFNYLLAPQLTSAGSVDPPAYCASHYRGPLLFAHDGVRGSPLC
jgi:hypothetical protein